MKIRPLRLTTSTSEGATDNFCCCLTRAFLIIIGLVGAVFFLGIFGLSFVSVERRQELEDKIRHPGGGDDSLRQGGGGEATTPSRSEVEEQIRQNVTDQIQQNTTDLLRNQTDNLVESFDAEMEKAGLPGSFAAGQAFVFLLGLAHCLLVIGALLENRVLVIIFIALDTLCTLLVVALCAVIAHGCFKQSKEYGEQGFEAGEEVLNYAGIIVILVFILPTVAVYAIVMAASCSYCLALARDEGGSVK